MTSHIFIKIFGLVYKVYLTNKEGFGDKGNAICAGGFQIYALLLTISSIGIPNAISKLVSERVAVRNFKGAHKVFKIAFALFSCIGFACSLVLYIFAKPIANIWLQIPEAEYTLVALSPSIFFVTLISVIRGYFNGRENLKVTAKSQMVEQILKIVFTILIVEGLSVASGNNTTIMVAGANLAVTFASVIGFVYLYIYYISRRKELTEEIKTGSDKEIHIKKIIKSILVVSLPMTATALLGSINKTIDSITVVRGLKSFMTDSAAKTEYGIIAGKIDTLVMLPMSFNIALTTGLIPKISSLVTMGNTEKTRKLVSNSIIITVLIGLPCAIGLMFFSEPILKLLFPNQNSGTVVLQISSLSIIFILVEQTLSGVFQGFGKYMFPIYALIIGAITKLLLNLLLVPLNTSYYMFGGTNGAAISTVVSHIVIFIIECVLLTSRLKIKLIDEIFVFIKIFCITLIMIICSKFLYTVLLLNFSKKISTILSLAFAILIYFLLIFLTKTIKLNNFFKEEV